MADREVRAILTGSSAGAVKAFSETAVASEGAGKSISAAGENAGSAFSNSLTKAIPGGEKVASMLEGLKNPYVMAGVAAVTAAVVIGGAAIDMANKYDDATAKMAASAGITIEQANKIGDALLETGGQTVYSAQQMMEAYGPVSNQLGTVAGHALTASDSLAFMSQATTLAEASGQDLTTTTANLASVMQTFHQPLSAANADIDVMFNSARAVNMPIADYTTSIEKLHSKLGDVGGSLPQLSTMFMDFAEHGLTGRTAMTTLTSATNSLLASNDKASAAYQKQNDVVDKDTAALNKLLSSHKATTAQIDAAKATLATANADLETLSQGAGAMGLNIYNASGQFIGMQSVIEQLQPKLKGMSDAQRRTAEDALFGAGSFDKMDSTIMAGKSGWDTASAAVNKHGTATAAAAVSTDTLSGKFDKAKTFVADLGVKIGQDLIRGFSIAGEWVNKAIDWFGQYLPTVLNVLGKVFSVVFTAVGIYFQVMMKVAQVVFAAMTIYVNVWIAVIRAIVTVVSAVVTAVSAVIHTLAPIFAAVFGAIAAVVTTEINVVSAVVSAGWAVISTVFRVGAAIVGAVIGGLVTTLQAIWKVITTVLIQPVSDAVSGISGFIGNIVGFFTGLPGRIVGGLAGMGATIWNTISGEFGKVTSGISGWITTAISWFTGLPGRMAQGFVNMGGDLAQGFKTAVNDAVINPIDTALKWIGDLGGSIGPISFHIRDAFGGSMPQIPRLAMGGIVSAPTLALIGEAGPEAVVPLDRHPSSVGLGGDTHNHYYQITVTGADPNAVVLALKRYMQRNGSVPIKLAS